MASPGLTDAKRALFERLVAGTAQVPSIARRGLAAAPLSFAQQRLWILEQMRPGTVAYNSHVGLRLRGLLDVVRLENALQQIVRRHEVLRTAFAADGAGLEQRVGPAAELVLERADCSTAEEPELLRRMLGRHLPLDEAPLMRALLLRTSSDVHTLLVVVHHAAFDGWSAEILTDELLRLYGGEMLPDLPAQYGDYSAWQRERFSGARLSEEMEWWRRRLEGASPVTTFPPDRSRSAPKDEPAAIVRSTIDATATRALRAFSRESGATMFMTLLAAFDALLSRYSGDTDVVIGSPVAGRVTPECEPMIGLFMNALPIRVDLGGRRSFRELLARVRSSAVEAYAHQELSFELIIDAANPERTLALTPFSHVTFQLRSFPQATCVVPGLVVERLRLASPAARSDLGVEVRDDGQTLDCLFEYSTSLYDRATVERIARHYGTLLERALASPDAPLASLPLLDEEEYQQIVYGWNRTAVDYRSESTVTQLFEETVARRAGAVAVVEGERSVTYRELDLAAEAIAAELRAAGIPPRSAVAISGQRSIDVIAGTVAVLKAGCCYVPIDPAWPAGRVRVLLDRCGARAVLAGGTRLELLQQAAAAPADPRPIGPGDAIYVMYTSGSTGEPKGIAVPHRGVTRLVINTNVARLSDDTVMAMSSSFAFDGATFEIWGALLNGGTLAIISRDEVLDVARLQQAVRRYGVTAMFLTTSVVRQHASLAPGAFHGIRELLPGGEALDALTAARLLHADGPQSLVNVYGPTEVTAWAISHQVTAEDAQRGVIPIGRPISNTTAYVLDDQMAPQPVGVTGELYLGGPGVALGYIGRPDLTAERFVDSPFVPGERLYRTGDLGRFRADGVIEFLGRNDDQIKLRGFRIEPGEIETALLAHRGVANAAVAVRPVAGEPRLVAWVAASAPSVTADGLRQFLTARLPDYLVPAVFVVLDRLPLNSSGKVDRKALPAPEGLELAGERTPLRDALDEEIAALMRASLGVATLGLDDDFFEAGGNSLGSIRLIAAIEKRLERRVPVEVFFREPTVRGMADYLRGQDRDAARRVVVELQPEGTKAPLFLVPGGDGTEERLLGFQRLAREITDRPVYGLFYSAEAHGGCRSIEEVASLFCREIEMLVPHGPYLFAGHCVGGTVAYEIAQQLRARGAKVEAVVMFETRRPAPGATKFEAATAGSRVRRFFSRLGYHLGRITEFPLKDWPAYARSRLVFLRMWARYLAGSRPRSGTWRGAGAAPEPQDIGPYTAMVKEYEPPRWDGPVTLVLSEGVKRPWEMEVWRRVATRARVVRLPGDHMSILGEHAAHAARAIRQAVGE